MADNTKKTGTPNTKAKRAQFEEKARDVVWFVNEGAKELQKISANPSEYGFTLEQVNQLRALRSKTAEKISKERPDEFFLGQWYPGGVAEVAKKRKEFRTAAAESSARADAVRQRGPVGDVFAALQGAEQGIRLPVIAEAFERKGIPGQKALEDINWDDPALSGGARFGFGVAQSFPTSAGSISGNIGGAALGGGVANLAGMLLGRSPVAMAARGILSGAGALAGGIYGAQKTGEFFGDRFSSFNRLSQPAKREFLETLSGPEQKLGEYATTAALFSPLQRSPLSGRLTLGENVGFREGVRQFIENPARVGTPAIVGPAMDLGSRIGQMASTQKRIDKSNIDAQDAFKSIYGREGSPEELKAYGYQDEKDRLGSAVQDLILGGFTKLGKTFALGAGGGDSGIEMQTPAQGLAKTQAQQTINNALSFQPQPRGTNASKFVIRTTQPEGQTLAPVDILFDNKLNTATIQRTTANMSDSFWAKFNRTLQSIRPVRTTQGQQSIVGVAKFGEFFVTTEKDGRTQLQTLTFDQLPNELKTQARRAQEQASRGESVTYDVTGFTQRQYSPVNDSYSRFEPYYPAQLTIDGTKVFAQIVNADDPNAVQVRLPSGTMLVVPKSLIPIPANKKIEDLMATNGPRKIEDVYGTSDQKAGVAVAGNPLSFAVNPATVVSNVDNPDAWKSDYQEYIGADGNTYPFESVDELVDPNAIPIGSIVSLGNMGRKGSLSDHRAVVINAEQVDLGDATGYAYRVQSLTYPGMAQFYVPPAFPQLVQATPAAPPATATPAVSPAAPTPAAPAPPAPAAVPPPTPPAATTPPVDPATAPTTTPVVDPAGMAEGAAGGAAVAPITAEERADMEALLANLEEQIAALESMVPTAGGETEPSAMSTFDADKANALSELRYMAAQLRAELFESTDATTFREKLAQAKQLAEKHRTLALTASSGASFALPPGTTGSTVVAPTPSAGTPAGVPAGTPAGTPAGSTGTTTPPQLTEADISELKKLIDLTRTDVRGWRQLAGYVQQLPKESVTAWLKSYEIFPIWPESGDTYDGRTMRSSNPIEGATDLVVDNVDSIGFEEQELLGFNLELRLQATVKTKPASVSAGTPTEPPAATPAASGAAAPPSAPPASTPAEPPAEPPAGTAAGTPDTPATGTPAEPLATGKPSFRRVFGEGIKQPEDFEFEQGKQFKEIAADDDIPAEMRSGTRGAEYAYRRQTAGVGIVTEDSRNRKWLPKFIENIQAFRGQFGWNISSKDATQTTTLDVNLRQILNKDDFKKALMDVYGQSELQAESLASFIDRMSIGWAKEILKISGWNSQVFYRAIRNGALDPSFTEETNREGSWRIQYREQAVTAADPDNLEVLKKLQTYFYAQRLGQIAELSDEAYRILKTPGVTQGFYSDAKQIVNVAFALRGQENYPAQVHEVMHLWVRSLYAPMIHELAAKVAPHKYRNKFAEDKDLSQGPAKEAIRRDIEEQIVTAMTLAFAKSDDTSKVIEEQFEEGGATFDPALQRMFSDIGEGLRVAIAGKSDNDVQNILANRGWNVRFNREKPYPISTPVVIRVGGKFKQGRIASNPYAGKGASVIAVQFDGSQNITSLDIAKINDDDIYIGQLKASIGYISEEDQTLSKPVQALLARWLGHYVEHTNNLLDSVAGINVDIQPFEVVGRINVQRFQLGYRWWKTEEEYKFATGNIEFRDERIARRTDISYLGWLDTKDNYYEAWRPSELIAKTEYEGSFKADLDYREGAVSSPVFTPATAVAASVPVNPADNVPLPPAPSTAEGVGADDGKADPSTLNLDDLFGMSTLVETPDEGDSELTAQEKQAAKEAQLQTEETEAQEAETKAVSSTNVAIAKKLIQKELAKIARTGPEKLSQSVTTTTQFRGVIRKTYLSVRDRLTDQILALPWVRNSVGLAYRRAMFFDPDALLSGVTWPNVKNFVDNGVITGTRDSIENRIALAERAFDLGYETLVERNVFTRKDIEEGKSPRFFKIFGGATTDEKPVDRERFFYTVMKAGINAFLNTVQPEYVQRPSSSEGGPVTLVPTGNFTVQTIDKDGNFQRIVVSPETLTNMVIREIERIVASAASDLTNIDKDGDVARKRRSYIFNFVDESMRLDKIEGPKFDEIAIKRIAAHLAFSGWARRRNGKVYQPLSSIDTNNAMFPRSMSAEKRRAVLDALNQITEDQVYNRGYFNEDDMQEIPALIHHVTDLAGNENKQRGKSAYAVIWTNGELHIADLPHEAMQQLMVAADDVYNMDRSAKVIRVLSASELFSEDDNNMSLEDVAPKTEGSELYEDVVAEEARLIKIQNQELRSALSQLNNPDVLDRIERQHKTQRLFKMRQRLIELNNTNGKFLMRFKSYDDLKIALKAAQDLVKDPNIKTSAEQLTDLENKISVMSQVLGYIDKQSVDFTSDVKTIASILETFAPSFDNADKIGIAAAYRNNSAKVEQFKERMRFDRLMGMMLDNDILSGNLDIWAQLSELQKRMGTSRETLRLLNLKVGQARAEFDNAVDALVNAVPAEMQGDVRVMFVNPDAKLSAKRKAEISKVLVKDGVKQLVQATLLAKDNLKAIGKQQQPVANELAWDHAATDENSPFWVIARAFGNRIGDDFVEAETREVKIPRFELDTNSAQRFTEALSSVAEVFSKTRSYTNAIDAVMADTYRQAQLLDNFTPDQVAAFRLLQAQRYYDSFSLTEEKASQLLRKTSTYDSARKEILKSISEEESRQLKFLTDDLKSGRDQDELLSFILKKIQRQVQSQAVQKAFESRWRNKTLSEQMIDYWQLFTQRQPNQDIAELQKQYDDATKELASLGKEDADKQRKTELRLKLRQIDASIATQRLGDTLKLLSVPRNIIFQGLETKTPQIYSETQVLEASLRVREYLEQVRLIPVASEYYKVDNQHVIVDIAKSDNANVTWSDALSAIKSALSSRTSGEQTIEQRFPREHSRYKDILSVINESIATKSGEKRQVLTNDELVEIVRLNRNTSVSGLEAAGIFAKLQEQRDAAVKQPLKEWLTNKTRTMESLSMREINNILSDEKLEFTEADKLAAVSSILRITTQLSDAELHNFILVNRRMPTPEDVDVIVSKISAAQREAKRTQLLAAINKLEKLQAETGVDALVNRAIATRVSFQVGRNMDQQNFVSFLLPVSPMDLKINDAMAAQSIIEQMSNFKDDFDIVALLDDKRIVDSYMATRQKEQINEASAKLHVSDKAQEYRKALTATRLRDALVTVRGYGRKSPLKAKGVQLPGTQRAGEKRIYETDETLKQQSNENRLAARIVRNGSDAIDDVVRLIEQEGVASFDQLTPVFRASKVSGLRAMWANTLAMETMPPDLQRKAKVALAKFADAMANTVFDARMNILAALESSKYATLTFERESPESQVVVGRDEFGRVKYRIDYREARAYKVSYDNGTPVDTEMHATARMTIFSGPEGVYNTRSDDGKFVWNQAQMALYSLLTEGVPDNQIAVHQAVADAVDVSGKLRIAPDVYWYAMPRVESGVESMNSDNAEPMFMSTLIDRPEHVFRAVGAVDPTTQDKYVKPVIASWLRGGVNGQPRVQLGLNSLPVFDGYGYTVWDKYGKRSHVYAKLRAVGLSHDKALEIYALTEHPAFERWVAGDLIEAPMMSNPGSLLNQGRSYSASAVPRIHQGIKAQDLMYAIDRFMEDPSDAKFDDVIFAYDEIKLLGGQLTDKQLLDFAAKIKTSKDRDLSLQLLRSQAEQIRNSVSNEHSDVVLRSHAAYKESEREISTGKPFTTMAFDHIGRSFMSYSGKGVRTFDIGSGLYNNRNRTNSPHWIRFKNPLVVTADNNNPTVQQMTKWSERALSGKYDGIVIKDVVDSYNNPTRKILAVTLDEKNVLPVSSMTTPFEKGNVATADDFEPMFMSTMIAPVTNDTVPPLVVGSAQPRKPTSWEIAQDVGASLLDNAQAVSRMPLALDLAFANIQGGKAALTWFVPLRVYDQPIYSPKGWKFDTSDSRIAFMAFIQSLQGLMPNMQVTLAGQKIGFGKFGRRQWLRVYLAMRQDPYFQLMKEMGVPLHFLNFERKLDSERARIFQENQGRISWDQIEINMLDYDERGNLTDMFERNTIVGMLPLQGMFERQMSLQHDLLLYGLIRHQLQTNPAFRDLDPADARQRGQILANKSSRALMGFTATALGDFQYTTNDRADLMVSRMGKWVSGAPRWYLSNVAVSWLGNSLMTVLHSRSAWWRSKVGTNNRSYGLFQHENPELRAWQHRMFVGPLIFWGTMPIIAQIVGNLLLDREDIRWGGFLGRVGQFRIGDVAIKETTGTWDAWNVGTGFLRQFDREGGAGSRPKLGETEQEAKMEPYWGAYRRLQYRWSPAITLMWNKLVQGRDVLGRAVFDRDPEFTKMMDEYFVPKFVNAMAKGLGLPELGKVPFSSRLITGQFPVAWQETWNTYSKAAKQYPTDPAMREAITWGTFATQMFGMGIKYEPYTPKDQMDFLRESMYIQRKYESEGPNFKQTFDRELSKAVHLFLTGDQ